MFLPTNSRSSSFFFFFNDTATTEIYTLSLHDALPICHLIHKLNNSRIRCGPGRKRCFQDRKSTRLNSSHGYISYAVFCLKKKKNFVSSQILGARSAPALAAGAPATSPAYSSLLPPYPS